MQLLQKLEYVKQLIKDGKLNEAYSQVLIVMDEPGSLAAATRSAAAKRGPKDAADPLVSELLAVIAGLIKALSINSNFRFSEELLSRTLNRIEPKDDHFFLSLADQLVHSADVSVNTTKENAARCDKLLDQAIRIREKLVGADGPTAELIIESVLSNLQRARHSANNNMAAEAGSRLARCRTLMSELERLMQEINRPANILVARFCTLKAFFAHSSGQKNLAKDSFINAMHLYDKIAASGHLERSDVFEMFLEQAQHFSLNSEEKQSLDRIKLSKMLPKKQATLHKIRAFPTMQHIEEIMDRARSKPGKSFYLTSLGFLGAQALNVSVICNSENNDLDFKIESSKSDSEKQEIITLTTDDSAEVLRHIKDLWRRMQAKPASAQANLQTFTYNPEAFADQDKAERNKKEFTIAPGDRKADVFQSSAGTSYGSMEAQQAKEALAFEGNLKAMPSFGLLQTIALNENTGVLEVSQRDGLLKIYFDSGKPVDGTARNREGVDVLYEFVLLEEGYFRFHPEKRSKNNTIRVKLDSFILEAASLFDQTKYLKSLGMTMYSGIFAKEHLADWQGLSQALSRRNIEHDEHLWQLYQAIENHPIIADAVEQADLSLRLWTPALYKLVQSGLVTISNDRLDDEDLSHNLVTNWSYDRKKVDEFSRSLYDSRTGLLRFEFFIWIMEREIERAQTHAWPLTLTIFEMRRSGKDISKLTAADKEIVQTTLAEISDSKRAMDWFCHFEEEQYAILMPGLDTPLASMFVKNFADICARNLGKLKDGQSEWEYSFGIASIPDDTIEWTKMIGLAGEAQRKARISRRGYAAHKDHDR